MPKASQLASSVSTWALETGSAMPFGTVRGRHVVVGPHSQVRADAPHRTLRQLQPLERLRAGHFVQQVAIDVEQRRAVFLDVDGVVIPEFVVERLGHDAGGQTVRPGRNDAGPRSGLQGLLLTGCLRGSAPLLCRASGMAGDCLTSQAIGATRGPHKRSDAANRPAVIRKGGFRGWRKGRAGSGPRRWRGFRI